METSPPNPIAPPKKSYKKLIILSIFLVVILVFVGFKRGLISKLTPLSKLSTQTTQPPKGTNTFTGIISDISGNTITVTTLPVDPTSSNSAVISYKVNVADDTVISRLIPTAPTEVNPKLEKISLADLKKGMQITIFTDSDIGSQAQFKASKINVLPTSQSTKP